jgi:ABC-type multidrug transport system fused ATPase/permease subunit
MVAERMFKLYVTSILAAEVVALAALAYLAPRVALFLVVLIPTTLLAAFILRHGYGGRVRGLRRLSPEAIAHYRPRVSRTDAPEALSRAIVERAEEIQRALEESPSDEVRVEMCALGYRACANDMITLTHLTNEALPNASFIRRFRLRRGRKRAIDSLSEARKALPPGALRTAAQEK